jgi:hypothetical protein
MFYWLPVAEVVDAHMSEIVELVLVVQEEC